MSNPIIEQLESEKQALREAIGKELWATGFEMKVDGLSPYAVNPQFGIHVSLSSGPLPEEWRVYQSWDALLSIPRLSSLYYIAVDDTETLRSKIRLCIAKVEALIELHDVPTNAIVRHFWDTYRVVFGGLK